jgi:prolyl oligopeptidase
MIRHCILIFIILLNFSGCKNDVKKEIISWSYPSIDSDTVIDTLYGIMLVDPFRNIENINSEKIRNWLLKQRNFCDSVLSNVSNNSFLAEEINQYLNYSKVNGGFPRPLDRNLVYVKKSFKTNIYNLYYVDEKTKVPVELFSTDSINKLTGSFYSIDFYEPSPDGKLVSFGLSPDGTESSHIYIMDIERKQILVDRIDRSETFYPQWLADGSAFFYTRLKELNSKEDSLTMFDDSSIYLHTLGTDQIYDKLIINSRFNTNLPLKNIDISILSSNPASKFVILQIREGVSPYIRLYSAILDDVLRQKANQIKWRLVCDSDEKVESFTTHKNSVYLLSFKASSNGGLYKYDLENSESEEFIYGNEVLILDEIIATKNAIYINCIENGVNRILSIDIESDKNEFIALPFNGSVDLIPDFPEGVNYSNSKSLFFRMRSWNKASEIYSYDPVTRKTESTKILSPEPLKNQDKLKVEEVEVTSDSGIKVPLSIIYSSDIELNGNNPTVIYAYGAYGYSMMPYFLSHRMAWYNRGIIFAIAHVRGGGEKGDDWHKGGFKSTKPNSWKDLIACTEYLVAKKYTQPARIVAKGESAGGITIGRAIQERPDLFKAAVIRVGALNPLRDEFTTNSFNTTEFGTIYDSLECSYLHEMDVYQQINTEIQYPSLYLTAGINDNRVAAWQPAKVAAKLQASDKNKHVVLFRVSQEGHFAGSDLSQELADEYTFIFWQLGIKGFEYKGGHKHLQPAQP